MSVLNKKAIMARLTDSMGVVLGATVSTAANGLVEEDKRDAWAIPLGLAKIGAGIALPLLMQGNKIVEGVGDGMIAIGTLDVLRKMSPETFPSLSDDSVSGVGDQMLLSGIGADDYVPNSFVIDDDYVQGTDNLEDATINGDFDTSQLQIN